MEQKTLVALAVAAGCLDVVVPDESTVIEAFATNAAEKPFTDCIRSWGLMRCSE